MENHIFQEINQELANHRTEARMIGDRLISQRIRNKQTQLLAWLNGSSRIANFELDNKTLNNLELDLSKINVEKQQIDINVVRYCPAKCEFCSVPASRYIDQIDTEKFLAEAERLVLGLKSTNVDRVIITGGEPLQDIDRLRSLIKILSNSEIDWKVFSIITNGQHLSKIKHGNSYPSLLEKAGLKQMAWSIHSFDSDTNNKIFGIPIGIQSGFDALSQTNLEIRLNLTLNSQGVNDINSLQKYLDKAGKYKVNSIYCRDLFDFVDPQIGYESHHELNRNQAKYFSENHIDTNKLILELQQNKRFQVVNKREFDTREKTEHQFLDLETGIMIFVSLLTIGNEHPTINQNGKIQLPYLVMQPDGKLYTDYINGKAINF